MGMPGSCATVGKICLQDYSELLGRKLVILFCLGSRPTRSIWAATLSHVRRRYESKRGNMEMERTEDFRALRAKFQNDTNFSSTLLPPAKTLPAEIPPRHSTNGSSVSHPKPKLLRRGEGPVPEQKTEPFNYMSQKSEIVQVKPVLLPRVRLRELSETGKNEDGQSKDLAETFCARVAQVADSQKQHPTSYHGSQEAALANNCFRNALHIWESALLQSDRKCPVAPPQHSNRTSLAQPKAAHIGITPEAQAKAAGNEQVLELVAPNNLSHVQVEPISFPTVSPPVPPRSHASSEREAYGAIKVVGFSQDANDLDRSSKTLQCSNERLHDVEEIKLPKIKPLPSIISLGPPPKKPPRPPKVNLGAFQQKFSDEADDAYMTPEITETEELNTYEETISYLKYPESSTDSAQETPHSSKEGKRENIKKQSLLLATPSTETEDMKERGARWNHETPNHQYGEKTIKISGHGGILTKPKIIGEHRGEKCTPPEETTPSFPGTRLAKDGNYDYVCLEALKIDDKEATLGPRTAIFVQDVEEVYDDVEGIQREFQASDAYSSFTSDTFSDDACEETYEDVQCEGYNITKPDDVKVEKLKGLGKFFKKGKFKMKNTHLKENLRNLSSSASNLDVMAQEGMVYDNVDAEQNDTKPSSRNFFKVKKYNLEKNNKMSKEEKLFREKFMYDKEIVVINTAVAHCSNTSTKGKLDLRITAGEPLEVIDITEGNQLICRNSEGKYGYVLLEHLNFSRH
ncbi:FYN-binding protein 2 isoform X2 [Rhineura floridana]|uniref:FYN-binding protein 2 isoform X2 n=1 Tax=Rhineura floridana TaxID=261503 RepID=UPI002AC80265|nr:FYN-binding protein 2 isoform X2 [Rhineura floridana]